MFWMEKWWSPWSWISIESKKCVGKHDSQMHFVCTFMCEIKICGRKICIEIFGIDEWKLGKTCSLLEPEGRGNKKKSVIHFFVSIDIIKISMAKFTCSNPRTTDTRRLNPQFFAAQIQILIPNKYLGCGYTDLGFCRNNGWIMENMDKGLTVPKWGLIVWPKIPQILEFVTCGVELLRGHCTDIPADQGSY